MEIVHAAGVPKHIIIASRRFLIVNRDGAHKARLVAIGYKDPDVTLVDRDAPILSSFAEGQILPVVASQKWRLKSCDIKTAFLNGDPPGP